MEFDRSVATEVTFVGMEMGKEGWTNRDDGGPEFVGEGLYEEALGSTEPSRWKLLNRSQPALEQEWVPDMPDDEDESDDGERGEVGMRGCIETWTERDCENRIGN